MKLAFDKLNQHQIIIHRSKEKQQTSYLFAKSRGALNSNFISSLFVSLSHIIWRWSGEDELWIKLNKYLIALFCSADFFYSIKSSTVESL